MKIKMQDAEVSYFPEFLTEKESQELAATLAKETPWQQQVLKMYGKEIKTPRLTAWYGDPETTYSFSGTTFVPNPWTETLIKIKHAVESLAGQTFNSVLLNLYRDGQDSVGWHSDDEPELGEDPIIASVSLGATRKFKLRHKKTKETKDWELQNGTLLVMGSGTQPNWEHSVPKTAVEKGWRINLTFRRIGNQSLATIDYNDPEIQQGILEEELAKLK
jgi:alkylated DNA repair dioxygenase AlkB